MALRLYTFTISHFSEKVRWALDLNGLEYEERPLLPGPHILFVRRRAPRSTVPVLEHEGTFVQGSQAILDYIETRLGATKLRLPPSDAKQGAHIEALADRAFGLGTQRIFYATLLEHPRLVVDLWTQGGPSWGRPFYRVVYPLIARAVKKTYRIVPAAVEEAKDLFRRAFDETDRALASNPYLLGASLSRADVTVASLLAPLCEPPEHVLRWPSVAPPEHTSFVAEFRDRPTWMHVRRLYREHRHVRKRADRASTAR